MRVNFKLEERLAGFAATSGKPGERAAVTVSEMISSFDGVFASRVDFLHASVFGRIPGLPKPWELDHLLVVIRPDLEATAYFNELEQKGAVRVGKAVQAGETIYARDVIDIATLDIGIEIPADCGFVFVRSLGWQRSVFYDFGPLLDTTKPRAYDLKVAFAKQALSLIRGLSAGTPNLPKVDLMTGALMELQMLIEGNCQDEGRYQQFLNENPWILGGSYGKLERHTNLDDENIPDFTGIRHSDGFRDIIELKQPFLDLFRRDGTFASSFHDAWAQAERYLVFARRNRDYLASQKNLHFENPRCLLVAGFQLSPEQVRVIKDKESLNPAITVLTYDSIITIGQAMVELLIVPPR